MDQQPQKGCRLIHLLMVASLFSLGLQIAGYASTGWYRIEVQAVRIDFGLYQVGLCVYSICVLSGYAGLPGIDTNEAFYQDFIDWLTEYRLMASFALVADIIITFIILMYLIQSRSRRFPAGFQCQLGTVIFMGLASGGLAIACAAKVGAKIIDDKNLPELSASNNFEFPFPYSLLIFGLGGIVSALASVVTIFLLMSELKANKAMTTTPPTLELQQVGVPAMEMQQGGAVGYSSPKYYYSPHQQAGAVGYSSPKHYYSPHQQAGAVGYSSPKHYYSPHQQAGAVGHNSPKHYYSPHQQAGTVGYSSPKRYYIPLQQMQNMTGYISPNYFYAGLYPNAQAPSAPIPYK